MLFQLPCNKLTKLKAFQEEQSAQSTTSHTHHGEYPVLLGMVGIDSYDVKSTNLFKVK